MNWIHLLEKGIWFGFAAMGFAVLFNVPVRTLRLIFLIGAIGGLMKALLLELEANVIFASLGGAILVGYVSILAAHNKHAPPMVFAIPSVIPMVPGVFAYRMMLGVIQLSGMKNEQYDLVLVETIDNGLKATFILFSLALGVAIPLLITRKDSIKKRIIK
ncbi:threonine/serine exporter family protein [Reichenbachiella ulvae]|uniref:Threonine/serine exporter family protein n=1 Tax=Reichenbachiella ulvae TaxID=2980104 RepID=A0ABT3CUD3_9BACT|nr:threonine/serine exporter family protein [Reichenbachiella ulvae]MCV9387306.1 threonine/serine exporter family protein [Reichenbachiella ulvae]